MPKTSTSWKPGQTGNPNGRPKGSRDAIKEAFLKDLAADWQENGESVLRKAREERPAEFCRMVAGLLPKDMNVKSDDPVHGPHLAAMLAIVQRAESKAELARLKEEIAVLKGETPEGEPGEKADPVH